MENLQWDNREEGETPLRQMQLVELRLLRIFDQICRKHGLTYYIAGGTLLGAVRHGGFIPWDDDIDVEMPIDDAKKFNEIVNAELPEDVYSGTTVSPHSKSHYPCLKLYDAYSSTYTDQSAPKTNKHLGISLDIFTVIPYIDDERGRMHRFYEKMHFVRRLANTRKLLLLRPIFSAIMHFMDWLFRKMNVGTKTSWGYNPWTCGYGWDWRTKTEDLFPCKPIMFEGFEFMGPNNPDAYLRHYGDYMKLPPEDKRKPHEEIILPFTKCNHPKAMAWPKNCK